MVRKIKNEKIIGKRWKWSEYCTMKSLPFHYNVKTIFIYSILVSIESRRKINGIWKFVAHSTGGVIVYAKYLYIFQIIHFRLAFSCFLFCCCLLFFFCYSWEKDEKKKNLRYLVKCFHSLIFLHFLFDESDFVENLFSVKHLHFSSFNKRIWCTYICM